VSTLTSDDDMQVVDELLANAEMEGPTFAGEPTERKCRRHRWVTLTLTPAVLGTVTACIRCEKVKDETMSRRGRTSRSYGNRAELHVARTYGGTKIGQAGGPVDVRGRDWNTQVKTHRRPTPTEWRKVFAALSASTDRLPRLLLRFVGGPGVPPDDYFVVPAKAWLDWFGKDEDAA
jgi:hypothetical protein